MVNVAKVKVNMDLCLLCIVVYLFIIAGVNILYCVFSSSLLFKLTRENINKTHEKTSTRASNQTSVNILSLNKKLTSFN